MNKHELQQYDRFMWFLGRRCQLPFAGLRVPTIKYPMLHNDDSSPAHRFYR
jgi:hypothetical protein